MKIITVILFILSIFTLSGCLCGSGCKQARIDRQKDLEASFETKCLSYGLEKGTPGFNACVGSAKEDAALQESIRKAEAKARSRKLQADFQNSMDKLKTKRNTSTTSDDMFYKGCRRSATGAVVGVCY